MKAVICQHEELRVDEVSDPVPAAGQVRLRVVRCGICGSDLHARTGSDQWAELAVRQGYDRFARSDQPVVFGHEFSGEVAEYGPEDAQDGAHGHAGGGAADPAQRRRHRHHRPLAARARRLRRAAAGAGVADAAGAQRARRPTVAALTEPMAVALHAVRRGEVGKRDVAIVIGCGPVGLGVILMLKAKGVRTVVASDYSPGRRALAQACGADVVVDPAQESPYEGPTAAKHIHDLPAALELALEHAREARAPAGRLVARVAPGRGARRAARSAPSSSSASASPA